MRKDKRHIQSRDSVGSFRFADSFEYCFRPRLILDKLGFPFQTTRYRKLYNGKIGKPSNSLESPITTFHNVLKTAVRFTSVLLYNLCSENYVKVFPRHLLSDVNRMRPKSRMQGLSPFVGYYFNKRLVTCPLCRKWVLFQLS